MSGGGLGGSWAIEFCVGMPPGGWSRTRRRRSRRPAGTRPRARHRPAGHDRRQAAAVMGITRQRERDDDRSWSGKSGPVMQPAAATNTRKNVPGNLENSIAIPDRTLEVIEDRADPASLVTLHGLGVLGTDSAVCCPDAFSTSHHSHSGRPGHDETHDRVLAARSRRRRPAPADRRRRCPARSTVSVERAAALIRGE